MNKYYKTNKERVKLTLRSIFEADFEIFKLKEIVKLKKEIDFLNKKFKKNIPYSIIEEII